MAPTLNPNGKRPQLALHDQQRIPLDSLITNSSLKRVRTALSQHITQRNTTSTNNSENQPTTTLKKSHSALIFPHPTHANNTPLDLLNPSNHSPTTRPTRTQRTTTTHHQHHPVQQHPQTHHPCDPRLGTTTREKHPGKDKDELKREMAQWQEKYRVAIKSFVFYLDRLDPSTTNDLKHKIRAWGARVDQFFSKEVTHIITDIPVPTNIPELSPSPRKRNTAYCLPSPTRNNKENGQTAVGPRRNPKRLSAACSPEKEASTDSIAQIHPLIRKALELKIKIWKTEKLLNFLYRLGDQRSPVKQQQLNKPSLPSLLLKEAQQGHTNEFDPVALRSDYYYFGPKAMFIMVDDTTQEHKPIIVKEYSRPKTRETSGWPIMWGGTEGKSAFSRHTSKQTYLHVRNRIRQMFEMRARETTRQMKLSAAHERLQSPDHHGPSRKPLANRTPPTKQQNLRRAVSMNILQRRQSGRLSRTTTAHQPDDTTEPDPDDDEYREIDHINKNAPERYRGHGRVFLAASGNSITVTSNVASATSTRSSALRTGHMGRQLVDKRLAALGKRPTFEINQPNLTGIGSSSLKREVGAQSSKDRLQTLRKELNPSQNSHMNKLKRCQSLDSSMIANKKATADSKAKARKNALGVRAKLGNGFELIDLRKLARNEEPKAGYCENCRLKYTDFRKHILTRKHRKFALDENNWIDLDDTLKKTTRRLKPGVAVPPSVREMMMLMHGSDEEEENEDDEDEDEVEDEEEEEEDQMEEENGVEDDEEEEEEEEQAEKQDVKGGVFEVDSEEEGEEQEEETEEKPAPPEDKAAKEVKRVETDKQGARYDDSAQAEELEEGEYDETEEVEEDEEEEEGQITQSNCVDHHPNRELEEGEWEMEPDQSDIVFL
ncbi:hypothetical protein PCANC_21815 [Puccinia coronata f. sp. avenae]|uniref:DBF4-type domain-containing protein n=1 Tax=Puccinia coronata f. sp. avenae TaxID=200324 RepID=A0A2N5SGA5_9BASI|nr:hypothetical protein PCANC_21815 [Puccinia coronata f. sp. avenae]